MRAAVPVVAAMFLATNVAWAGPNEQRVAQALFDEARRLMDQKRYSEACPKLAESQRLDPGGGTLLNLAVCHAADGKTATALVEYNEALAVATRDARHDREELARAAIAKLEAEVPRVTVVVPKDHRVAGLEIRIDDTALPLVAWDLPLPVDPGSHTVVASLPGRAPWTAVISVLPSEKKEVEIPLLAGGTGPAPAYAAPTMMPPSANDAPSPLDTPPADDRPTTTATSPLYVGLFAATLLAGATSAVSGVFALTEQSKAEDECLSDRNWCRTADGRDAAASARTLSYVSTTALVLTAVGVVTLLIVPSKRTVVKTKARASAFSLEATF